METLGGALFVSLTGVVCVCLEIYLPGAILGLFGLGSILYGAFLMYKVMGVIPAAVLIVLDAVCGYLLFNLSLKILPKTEAGKKILLLRNLSGKAADPEEFNTLKGARAKVITILKPTGTVEIDKKRYTARSEAGIIEVNEEVEVMSSDSNTLVVRKIQQ